MPPRHCLCQLPYRSASRIVNHVARTSVVVAASPTTTQTHAFSTTTARCNNLKKKVVLQAPPQKGGQKLNLPTKKHAVDFSKRPAPGERKAVRKRIVLQNTNALEVRDLKLLDASQVGDGRTQGEVLALQDRTVDQLRAVEAFKPNQGWGLFRKPATLMRREFVELGRTIGNVQAEGKRTIRRIVTGERQSGKSVYLLQAMSMAFLKGWVVMNFTDAQELTNGHTPFKPVRGSSPPEYIQQDLTAKLLSQIAAANEQVLSKLRLSTQHQLPIPVPSNTSLHRLASLGGSDPDVAWPFFRALWAELTTRSTPDHARPPIMICIDNVSYIMNQSAYWDVNAKPVHAHDLLLVRHIVEHLSARRPLPNGGAILAATSGSNSPKSEAMDFGIKVNEARMSRTPPPEWNRHRKIDERSLKALDGVDVTRLGGLSREEARSALEYYAKSGLLKKKVDEGLVQEKWTVAGGGIAGELERACIRRSF
ncbi:hypothetical protein K490DRAFT_33737 [Saccharata proteae CBS 121410]|uniref:Small ribosomal subunit protein mS29 n=1 Tax=Saccharata proteae CBS 121410 TaxID=1314787 RepID=A0A9P4LXH9_9PEZI|nr:hypothetical protein K490DRAFT_33737 [Saccharata proteae CBS 121410]